MESRAEIEEVLTKNPFGFISLNHLCFILKDIYGAANLKHVVIALKYAETFESGDYKYHRFNIAGIWLKNQPIDSIIVSTIRGISFSNNRGRVLQSTFKDNFFVINNLQESEISGNNFYIFSSAPVDASDIEMIKASLDKRQMFITNGCMNINQSFRIFSK